jgi:hypothetical protein
MISSLFLVEDLVEPRPFFFIEFGTGTVINEKFRNLHVKTISPVRRV